MTQKTPVPVEFPSPLLTAFSSETTDASAFHVLGPDKNKTKTTASCFFDGETKTNAKNEELKTNNGVKTHIKKKKNGNQTNNIQKHPYPSDALSHRRFLGDDECLRLSGVGHVCSPAELHRRGSPLLTSRVHRLPGSGCIPIGRSVGR